MEKIFVVMVMDWDGRYIAFFHHSSAHTAEEAVTRANAKYATESAYVDEVSIED